MAVATSGLSAAANLLNGDQALEQFDANLLLAGILAVNVRLANHSTEAVQIALLRPALQASGDPRLKPRSPKEALKRVMRYYGNRLYAKAAYAQTLADYEALALPLTATLAPQEERRGFLFFETKADATTLTGLTLTLNGLPAPITMQVQ